MIWNVISLTVKFYIVLYHSFDFVDQFSACTIHIHFTETKKAHFFTEISPIFLINTQQQPNCRIESINYYFTTAHSVHVTKKSRFLPFHDRETFSRFRLFYVQLQRLLFFHAFQFFFTFCGSTQRLTNSIVPIRYLSTDQNVHWMLTLNTCKKLTVVIDSKGS